MAPPGDTTDSRRPRAARGHGAELRDELIAHATELIDELGGAAGLSVRAVTKRAGVSPMSLYLHFADREDLVRAVIDRGFERFVAAITTARDTETDPLARLRAMGLAYVAFAREQPAFYTVIFGRARTAEAEGGVSAGPTAQTAFAVLVDAVAACLPDERRERDARTAALGIWSGLHGFVTLAPRPGPGFPDDEAFVAEIGARWLRELSAP